MNWYEPAYTMRLVIFSNTTKRRQAAASVRKHNNVAERQRFRAGCPCKGWRSCRVHANLRALCAGDLSIQEVANKLGRTEGSVKALQHRGLQSLARRLQPAVAYP